MVTLCASYGTKSAQEQLRAWYPLPERDPDAPPPAPVPAQLEARQVLSCDNTLGEAPMFHPDERALYWLDINGKVFHRYHPVIGTRKQWDLPEVAGSFAFTEDPGLFLMGFASGLSWWVASTGEVEKICDFEADLNTRPNDAKCDRAGNFIVGGYNNNHRNDEANITGCWRLTKELLLEEIMDYRFRCSNTTAFSLSGTEMYFCDTPTREIVKFRYSPTGKLSKKTSFYTMSG
jgi:L-arabinonolactonase